MGRREARLEGLAGATRVAEALRLAAEALGVPGEAAAVLRLDSEARLLRGEETLAEAGLEAGGEVEVSMELGTDGGGLRFLGWMAGRQVWELAGGPGDVATGPGYSLHAVLGHPDPAPAPDAAANEDDSVSIFAASAEGLAGAAGGLLGEMEGSLGELSVIEDALTLLNAANPAPAQVIVMSRACA